LSKLYYWIASEFGWTPDVLTTISIDEYNYLVEGYNKAQRKLNNGR